ncbi:MAE_28990/MAE_18760 family HEPN-like nuclease [Achromobacter anxifer]
MRFSAEFSLAERELSRLRADISHSDAEALSLLTPVRERAVAMRASAYIWMAAALERVVRDSLAATFREISGSSPQLRDLRLSLFALVCDGEFESVSGRARGNSWSTKVNMLQRTMAVEPAVLSEHILPLDGRTIRGEHFDVIWLVLGLSRDSMPSPIHRVALKDLADGRNEVAHGHEDPVHFGRKKATRDIIKLINRVEEVIFHLLIGLDEYIVQRKYFR